VWNMPAEIIDINGLKKIEPYIKKLAEDTSALPDRSIRISIGSNANRVEHVLELASDCQCPLNIHLLVHEKIRDKVITALCANPQARIVEENIISVGNLPSFIVSDAGYYIQDGLNFDEAILSFKNEKIRDFLKDIYAESVKKVLAA